MNNKKGFTLMEMLIVVAIIAILIAIAIPTFTSALEKSREAADASNIRAAYAEAMVEAMSNATGTSTKGPITITQSTKGWANVTLPAYLTGATNGDLLNNVKKGDTVSITVTADGTVTISSSTSGN